MRDDMSRLREDEIDRLIERLLRRRDQRERVRMVGDLSDQDGGAGSELKEVLEVARELQELANSGEQRGLELEDVRELIEANGQPSSGAEAHPEAGLLASAIRAGADAETVRELADVDPQIKELELKERRLESRQQMVGELVNGLAEANLGRALGEFVRGLKGGAPAGRSGAGDRGHRPARRERGRGRPRARGERPEDRWPEVEAQGPPNKRERQSKARERAEEADA